LRFAKEIRSMVTKANYTAPIDVLVQNGIVPVMAEFLKSNE
jgi:hypothetical protein